MAQKIKNKKLNKKNPKSRGQEKEEKWLRLLWWLLLATQNMSKKDFHTLVNTQMRNKDIWSKKAKSTRDTSATSIESRNLEEWKEQMVLPEFSTSKDII